MRERGDSLTPCPKPMKWATVAGWYIAVARFAGCQLLFSAFPALTHGERVCPHRQAHEMGDRVYRPASVARLRGLRTDIFRFSPRSRTGLHALAHFMG